MKVYLRKCRQATQGFLGSVSMLFTGISGDAALLDTILLRDCDLQHTSADQVKQCHAIDQALMLHLTRPPSEQV